MALQFVGGEDKIVIAGTGYGGSSTLRVERYNANGSMDGSFGSNGRVFLNTGYALDVAIQPDGKIVTIGDAGTMARLNLNGTLDDKFRQRWGCRNDGNYRAGNCCSARRQDNWGRWSQRRKKQTDRSTIQH